MKKITVEKPRRYHLNQAIPSKRNVDFIHPFVKMLKMQLQQNHEKISDKPKMTYSLQSRQ